MLIEAAARRWQVNARELAAADSVVTTPRAAAPRATASWRLRLPAHVPASPRFKRPQDYKIIGRSVPRLDIPAKVTGEMQYGIDVQLPGMLYATVKAAPVHGGKLNSVDPAPAMKIKGVERVVRLDDAVAVVAQGYWPASRGLAPSRRCSRTAATGRFLREPPGTVRTRAGRQGEQVRPQERRRGGCVQGVPANRIVEATYHVPFLHHAAMEPINATAQFKDGKLTVWAGEQDALASKASLVECRGLKAADVTLIARRRAAPSAAVRGLARLLRQVLQLAMQMAPRPIKMIWSREEDFVQGTYRPALASRIRAALDFRGQADRLDAALHRQPGPERRLPHSLRDRQPVDRVRRQSASCADGSWRSVAHTQHGFYTESFIDELARAAGRDPFEYRRDLLAPGSRHRRVLETAAERRGGARRLRRASVAASPWSRASARSSSMSSSLDRRGRHAAVHRSPRRSIPARSAIPTPPLPRSKAPSSWD